MEAGGGGPKAKLQFIYIQWLSDTILRFWIFYVSKAGIAWNHFTYKTNLAQHFSFRKLAHSDKNLVAADRVIEFIN